MKNLTLGKNTATAGDLTLETLLEIKQSLYDSFAIPAEMLTPVQRRTVNITMTFKFDSEKYKTDLLNDRRGAIMAQRASKKQNRK